MARQQDVEAKRKQNTQAGWIMAKDKAAQQARSHLTRPPPRPLIQPHGQILTQRLTLTTDCRLDH